MKAPDSPTTPATHRYWRLLGVIFAAALLLSLPFVIIGELPGERWLSAADDRAPLFAALGTLLLAVDVLLPVPSSAVGLLLGGRLGFIFGFVCCASGLILGHVIGYGIGRLTPRRWVASAPSAPGMLAVFLSRPLPVLAEALAVSAGATRMPLQQYLLAIVPGDAIYATALSAAGAQLLSSGSYLAALAIPMLLAVLAGWVLKRRSTRGARD